MVALLVALSGLPGVGKTTVALAVSERLGGVHLRLDTIESALGRSGSDTAPDAGYRVASALATDLLRAGHVVIADSVNPLQITRRAWAEAASRAGALSIDIEIVCSDVELHRTRVQTRTSDLDGLVVPTWAQVQARDYEPWDGPVLRVDTASGTDDAVDEIVAAIQASVTVR